MPPMFKPGAYCHVEIATRDIKRAKKFYGGLFGWKFQDMPGAPGGYSLYETSQVPGGGLTGCSAKKLPPVLNYILVSSVDAYIKKIAKAGGKVLEDKQEVPGFGWYASFEDLDGNRMAVWEPNMAKKPAARKPKRR